jgi:uncharacterized protein YjbI with pentapeptide repeats
MGLFARFVLTVSLGFSLQAFSRDLGFRYTNGNCVNGQGETGLNPGFIGQCGDLRGVTLSRLDMSDTDLSGSKFNSSDLQLTQFNRSILIDVDFEGAHLQGVEFAGAKIERSKFNRADLQNSRFGDAQVKESRFSLAVMEGLDLSYTNFSGCTFDGARLNKANLQDADFSAVNLQEATLEYTDMTAAKLVRAVFDKANLKHAIQARADLSGASFFEADLRSANLADAKVEGAMFAQAKYNLRTILPFTTEEADRQNMIFKKLTEISGIAHNLKMDELDGWTICHQSVFAADGGPIDKILTDCKSEQVMLACRKTGSDTLILAGHGRYDMVFKEIGTSNEGTLENDVQFYYSKNYSIGFAAPGSTLSRTECDVDGDKAEDRLCFHTINETLYQGYRCGSIEGLNDSKEYERLFLKSED